MEHCPLCNRSAPDRDTMIDTGWIPYYLLASRRSLARCVPTAVDSTCSLTRTGSTNWPVTVGIESHYASVAAGASCVSGRDFRSACFSDSIAAFSSISAIPRPSGPNA